MATRQAEKPKSEKPKAEKPKSEKPKPAKPKADKPKAENPITEKPKSEKPKAEKPAGKPRGRPGKPEPEKRERRQLTTAEWRRIRMEYLKGKTTYQKLAEKYGISASNIRKKASNEGWKKRKNKLDTKVEQKALERVCDARAREFEVIARVNDRMSDVLNNLLDFVDAQPPKKYDDLRGVESLSKAIAQVVQTKRDLYNIPSEVDKAKIEALREKNKLEREKWQDEQAEKAASKTAAAGTVFKLVIESEKEKGEDLDG